MDVKLRATENGRQPSVGGDGHRIGWMRSLSFGCLLPFDCVGVRLGERSNLQGLWKLGTGRIG